MKKEMLINVLQPEEIRIAIIEDGVLEELYVERTSLESYVGNIYKGRIVNIEPSIQAAFVDFGVGRNGFLHVSDVEPTYYRHLEQGGDRRPGGRDRGRGNDFRDDRRDRRGPPPPCRREPTPYEDLEDERLDYPAAAPEDIAGEPPPADAFQDAEAEFREFEEHVGDERAAPFDTPTDEPTAPIAEEVAEEQPSDEEQPKKVRRGRRGRKPRGKKADSDTPSPDAGPDPMPSAEHRTEDNPGNLPDEELSFSLAPKRSAPPPAETRPEPRREVPPPPRRSPERPAPRPPAPEDDDLSFGSIAQPTAFEPAVESPRREPPAEPWEESLPEEAPPTLEAEPVETPFAAGHRDEPPEEFFGDDDNPEVEIRELANPDEDYPRPLGRSAEEMETPPPGNFGPMDFEDGPPPPAYRDRPRPGHDDRRGRDDRPRDDRRGRDAPRGRDDRRGRDEPRGRDDRRGGGDRYRDDRGGRGRDDRGGRGRDDRRGGPPRRMMGGRPGMGRPKPLIQDIFKRGQEVIVQVIKEGIGTKGPTLSTYISIAGRYLVLMPGLARIGVSRKIQDDDSRRRLRDIMNELQPPKGLGFIIRTAGLDRNKKELQRDLAYLSKIYAVVARRIKKTRTPAEIYMESDMVTRTIRDIFTAEIDTIFVDEPEAFEKAKEFLQVVMPRFAARIKLYDDKEPMFHKYGIEDEIARIQQRKVPLPHGGSIVIDQAEACVAIDVNSGNFRADNNAEATAFQMNLQAAKEIARQLRLRDLGGVIVNDFIDMRDEKHRRTVEKALRDAIKRDRARTKILRMSQFGIIEMTRQRIRPSLKRSVYTDCAHCHATGHVKTSESMSIDVMRLVQLAAGRENIARIEIRVQQEVAGFLLNRKRAVIAQLEAQGGKQVVILGVPGAPPELLEFLCLDNNGSEVKFMPQEEPAPRGGRR